MSDNEGSAAAGWLHAQGDPPGTHRYWDGTAWQGEPVPIAPAPAPEEVVPPPPAMPAPAMPSQPDPIAADPLPSAVPPPTFDAPTQPLPSAAPPPTFDAPPAFTPPEQPSSTFTPSTFAESSTALSEPKSSKLKWIIPLVAVLALAIGGGGFLLFRAVSGPIDVGNEYLAAIEAQDFDAAWGLVDESCFPSGDSSDLAAVFAEQALTGYELKGSSVNSTNGTTTGTTSGTITLAGDDERSIQILASKPDGDWRVCGFDIGGPGSG